MDTKKLAKKHFKFRTKLMSKSEITLTKVVVCTEEYTSMTCTWCGNLDRNLGSSEVYNCKFCKTKINRDINGARNILIKNC